MTCVASYVSHHSTLLMAVDWPGDRWPPPRPRSVAWIVATRGAPQLTCRVLPAQATSQSWACTTSGRQPSRRAAAATRWWLAPAMWATKWSSGSQGSSARARTHPHPVDDRVLGGVGVVQREDDDLVPGPGQRSGQAVRVGRDAADDQRWVLPRQHGHSHGGPT